MGMNIWNDLALLINGSLEKSLSGYFTFFLASAFFGFLIFLLDWCFCVTGHKSLLNLGYKSYKKIPFLLLAYVFGAGGVGLMGVMINVLSFHINGAIGAGIGWPVILPRIFQAIEAKAPEQKIEREGN